MEKYLKESIKLELNVSDLYFLFSIKLPKYKKFWYELSLEEKNHASLLETALLFYKNNIIIDEFKNLNYIDIENFNKLFSKFEEEFLKDPTIDKAIEISLNIESSAAENHYNDVMKIKTDNKIIRTLQKLNFDDLDHYSRILNLKKKINR